MRVIEGAIFLSLAGALHVAALTVAAPGWIGGGSGDGGADQVTLTAIPPATLERWQMPPDTAQTIPELSAPHPDSAGPVPAPMTRRAPHSARPDAPEMPARPHAARALLPPEPRDASQAAPAALPLPQADEAAQPFPSAANAPARSGKVPDRPAPIVADSESFDPPNGSTIAPRLSRRPELRPDHFANLSPRPAPKPRAETASAGRKASTSVGTGKAEASTARAKPKKAPPAPAVSGAAIRQAQAQWGAQIRNAVARAQRYPSGSRATGTVTLRLTVARDGRLTGVSIVKSSGNAALDRAAVRAAQLARMPRAPKVLAKASYGFNLPLRFAR